MVFIGIRVVVVEVVDEAVLLVSVIVGLNQVFEPDAFVVLVTDTVVDERVGLVGGLRMISSPTWKYFVFKGTSLV